MYPMQQRLTAVAVPAGKSTNDPGRRLLCLEPRQDLMDLERSSDEVTGATSDPAPPRSGKRKRTQQGPSAAHPPRRSMFEECLEYVCKREMMEASGSKIVADLLSAFSIRENLNPEEDSLEVQRLKDDVTAKMIEFSKFDNGYIDSLNVAVAAAVDVDSGKPPPIGPGGMFAGLEQPDQMLGINACVIGHLREMKLDYDRTLEQMEASEGREKASGLELEECHLKINDLVEQVGRWQDTCHEMADKKDSSKLKRIEELQYELRSVSAGKTQYHNQVDSLAQDLEDCKAKVAAEKHKSENIVAEIREMREERDDLSKRLNQEVQVRLSWQSKAEEWRAAGNQLQERVQQRSNQVEDANNTIDQLQGQLAEVAELRQTVHLRSSEVEDAKNLINHLRRQHFEMEKKDFAIQELQRQLDEARGERDELREAQSTFREWMKVMVAKMDSNGAWQPTNADTPSGSTGQGEADTRSSGNNAGSTGGSKQAGGDVIPAHGTQAGQAMPGSQLNGGQGRRKPDTALPNGNGRQVGRRTDTASATPPAGSIDFNVDDISNGPSPVGIPQSIAEKLQIQVSGWCEKRGTWDRHVSADRRSIARPKCIARRINKQASEWTHGLDKACDYCHRRGLLCVMWQGPGTLRLLPIGGRGQGAETRWLKPD